ncbi:MAG: type IV pilus assembly protein PilM [Phycisphaerae bacterium]|nr:type IV pilus assembly protein PilM [Phycisphaerae bacterium]
MAGEKMVWGIDIGQCALKALKLQLVGDVVEAMAFDIVEHAKPLNPAERGGEALTEALTRAVETLMSRNDMAGNAVVIGVPGYQAFTRFTKLPPVEKKQLPAIVQFEAGQQIPYDINQVIWDYQIFSEDDSPDIEVGIFCMRTEQLDRYLVPFTDAGLQPLIVQPAPLALTNFIEHDVPRPGKATVLLDIGAESTDLIVSDRGSVWTRAVPIGGNNFTERLVEAFRLEFGKAESLKRQAATSKYARQIFQAMRPVYQDLVAEIQRSVGRYTQTHRDAELDRVVGMGNGFRLPGLQKFLQQNLGMKVERLSAFSNLQPGETLNAPTLNENVLSLGVAYGLAVQGLGRGHIVSNLLPPQIAKRAVWRRKRPFFAATAACFVLAAASLWARYFLDSSALARTGGSQDVSVPSFKPDRVPQVINQNADSKPPREYTADILGAASSLSSEWTKLKRQVDEGRTDVDLVMSLVDDQTLWPRIVDLVHRALPREDAPLVQAKTLDEYLAAIKQIPRKDRRQIILNTFQTAFSDNVAESLGPLEGEEDLAGAAGGRGGTRGARGATTPRGGSRGGGRAPARGGARGRGGASEAAARYDGRGFVVTLRGYTPYDYPNILEKFQETLKELGNPKDPNAADALGFHVLMPKKQEAPRRRDPALWMERRFEQPAKPTGEAEPEDEKLRDPVTNEPWVGDWLFTIRFGIVLGPSPEASAEPGDQKASGRAKPRGGARR